MNNFWKSRWEQVKEEWEWVKQCGYETKKYWLKFARIYKKKAKNE